MVVKPMFGPERMSKDELHKAIAYANKYIHVLMMEDEQMCLDDILLKLRLCKDKFGLNCAIIDPYNEIEHDQRMGESETNYVSRFLSRLRNFGRKHEIAIFLIAHPTKLQKNENGEYPVPTPYDISGSSNFRNKADNCIALWRSMTERNRTNELEVHIQKIRNKNIGQLGTTNFVWDYKTGIFKPSDNF